MEDPRVAGFQLSQKLLDLGLQFLNGLSVQNLGLPGRDELRPVGPLEPWVEVFFFHQTGDLSQ